MTLGKTIGLSLVVVCLIGWPRISLAYRPFDSTDAAVADVGELEIEFGPAQPRWSDSERIVDAPAYVINYGFAKNWEIVLEGALEHPLLSTEDTRTKLVDNGLFLKGVLREGVLQDKSGPSIATEFGALLPEINGDPRFGASLLGIVSQRWSWGTMHFDAGAALTRDHHGDLFLGTILEGPYDWTIRPVAEAVYERKFGVEERFSVLAGAIWRVRDKLDLDVGIREAWINRHPETEVRAGLTFAFSVEEEAMERSSQLRPSR